MTILNDRSPITFADPLPASVDVVVIGGGVIGISTARLLRKHGASVLVCEKGRVAGEQSSRNWGWIRQQGRDDSSIDSAPGTQPHWRRSTIGFRAAASRSTWSASTSR